MFSLTSHKLCCLSKLQVLHLPRVGARTAGLSNNPLPRNLLRAALHRNLSEGGSPHHHAGGPAPGGIYTIFGGRLSIENWDANHFLLQVLTKDSVTVSVDAVVYYRVSNATVSVANVENAHHSTRYTLL